MKIVPYKYGYNQDLFESVLEIYNEAFPESERRPVEFFIEMLQTGKSKLYIAIDGMTNSFNYAQGFLLINPIKKSPFCHLDYLAVRKECRGKQIGHVLLDYLSGILQDNNLIGILEAEHPDFGENKDIRKKRIKYYELHGAKLINNVYYALPDFAGEGIVEMQLMLMNLSNDSLPDTNSFIDAVKYIYKEFYAREADDSELLKILEKMPETLEL